jgi:hypothetical protein
MGLVFGALAVGTYLYMTWAAGGLMAVYSHAKGGAYSTSGYIGDGALFSFPAVLAIAVSCRASGARVQFRDVALSLLFMSPHLIQGTLGTRRGPIFVAVVTLFFAWIIAGHRRPSWRTVMIGIGVAGLCVFLVWSQRQYVYIGSEGSIELDRIWDVVAPETVTRGDTYVMGGASMLSVEKSKHYYWGYRYFVMLFIRPIPHQLWPTKYEDMGATWIYGYGMRDDQLDSDRLNGVGFSTPGGAAMPSIADGYLEFSWGALPLFFFIGWTYAKIWGLHRSRGGEWTIVFSVMLALSIYLASQSVTAWAYRLLLVSLPTMWIWRHWIEPPCHARAGRNCLEQRRRSYPRTRSVPDSANL